MIEEAAPGIAVVRDTCNVYVLRNGREGVVVDFGSGAVLDRLGELGLDRITDVLVTHHHRDQVQGLARAAAHGARIWVPPLEEHLIAGVDRHWQERRVDRDYDLSDDRFALREPVPVTGAVAENRTVDVGGFDVYTLPTPGHTIGSVTYLVTAGGRRVAFTGDLVYGNGQLWSLAATQWTYSGIEGQASTLESAYVLAGLEPAVLLPSHGPVIDDVQQSLVTMQERLIELIDLRLGASSGMRERLASPFEEVTPHLLRNRVSFANSHVLLSEERAALIIDFGYDTAPWQRPLLWSLDALAEQFGVESIDAVVTTHYHDDHVAGLNLLRAARGTEVWSPANVAPVLEEPHRYDLPCLWPEPIAVDRVLELGTPFTWREYELTAYPFPGHTLYAAAIAFEVDGKRVVATGDQYAFEENGRRLANYQYRNRFRRGDYVTTAHLLAELQPDLVISGHWVPRAVDRDEVAALAPIGERVRTLHDALLPEEGFGEEGFGARIEPYRCAVEPGGAVELEVTVRNPFARAERAHVELALPAGFTGEPAAEDVELSPHGEGAVRFVVRASSERVRRARVAADLTVGDVRFGEQAEALIDIE
ncbi:MAG TPA: MBL fold metallo-hydrolase [Gaiellaceae bacterium]|nr:MBL fold metallo-hydrolase [Gaiellaceae bacterium]